MATCSVLNVIASDYGRSFFAAAVNAQLGEVNALERALHGESNDFQRTGELTKS